MESGPTVHTNMSLFLKLTVAETELGVLLGAENVVVESTKNDVDCAPDDSSPKSDFTMVGLVQLDRRRRRPVGWGAGQDFTEHQRVYYQGQEPARLQMSRASFRVI